MAIFYKHAGGVPVFILFIHVDGMMLVAKDKLMIKVFKEQLKQYVQFTEGGDINWPLGIQIKHD